jgi:predicted SAM-dependent methyltransferase
MAEGSTEASRPLTRLNVGCGSTPTAGWRNFDSSLSVRVARLPVVPDLLRALGVITAGQRRFIEVAHARGVEHADATRHLPVAGGTADCLYTSHMLEHLEPSQAAAFLAEARRVLRPGGTIRVSVPDLRLLVQGYLDTGDADSFVDMLQLDHPAPRTVLERLRALLAGDRQHQWMYDGASLCQLLEGQGFVDARVMPAGETRIADPGALDLRERASQSVYVEATKA